MNSTNRKKLFYCGNNIGVLRVVAAAATVLTMTTNRAPKQWLLIKNETVTSFQSWKENIIHVLSLDANFAPFLDADITWVRKSTNAPTKGLVDDISDVPTAARRTVVQKFYCWGRLRISAPSFHETP